MGYLFIPILIDSVVYIALIEYMNTHFLGIQLSENIFVIGAGTGKPDPAQGSDCPEGDHSLKHE